MRPSTITMAELGCGRAVAPSIKVKFLSTAVSAQAAHTHRSEDRISFRRIFIAGGILSQHAGPPAVAIMEGVMHYSGIACVVVFCCSGILPAQQVDYLPLQVGNQWVY